MKNGITAALILFFTIVFAAGCGSDSPSPLDPGSTGTGGILDPNPDGVLLDGPPTDAARAALENLPPSPAAAADIADGLLTTRLMGQISPSATVGEVNAALQAQGARVVSMNDASPFITIKIPAVTDADAAKTVADALRASGAFLYVAPAHNIEVAVPLQPTLAAPSPSSAPEDVYHLGLMRMYNAWNAVALALDNNDEIPVLVPDEYASTLPHSDIDAQSFVGFGAPNPLPGPEIYPGNNGFVVSGVIGANPDDIGATGTSPEPTELLDVQSMALGGMTWADIFWNIGYRVATNGDRIVLNTGLGYNDPDFVTYSKFDRAMHVLAWRIVAALHYPKFIHVTSAGDDQEPDYNSPFIAAHVFDNVLEMVDLDALDPADALALETAWQDVLDNIVLASAIANNVLIVASPDGDSGPGHVVALGNGVMGPCVSQDPAYAPFYLCDGDVAWYGGTAMSAAQVSGVAAYMMNLSDISPAEVRGTIIDVFQSSPSFVVDAYDAILALDETVNGDVRRALLDVAGFESSEPDGKFDEYDLAILGPSLDTGGVEDYVFNESGLRFDLNGDGQVGGDGTGRFDLDANGAFGNVNQMVEGASVAFDEQAATDFEVLCFYAYSPLYTGDVDLRTQYAGPGHSGPFIEIVDFPDVIVPETPTEIKVRAGIDTDGVIQYIEGIEVEIEVKNGSADPSDGFTDAGGFFTANIVLDEDENEAVVIASADFGDGYAEATKSVVRPDQVEILERTTQVLSEVAFGYALEGQAFQWVFDNYDFNDQGPEYYDNLDESIEKSGAATAQGMTASGMLTATQVSNVWLFNGTDFAGCDFEGKVFGNMSLANPNLDIQSYQAQNLGWSEMCVEFVVWGTGAQFNMHGTVNGKYYDIELDGPGAEAIFLCDSSDDPCTTISTGGTLLPGYYCLDMCIADDVFFGPNCDGTDCDKSGSETQNSSLSLTFEITPGGGPAASRERGFVQKRDRERRRPILLRQSGRAKTHAPVQSGR